MKKIIYFVLVVIVFSLVYLNKSTVSEKIKALVFYSRCEKPITFRISSVDPKFNISSEEILSQTKQAADLWNNSYHKQVLKYDSTGNVAISLVFDERQSTLSNIANLDLELKNIEPSLQERIKTYNEQLNELDSKIKALNTQVDYWNKKGGAPRDIYNQLLDQQAQYKKEAEKLNKQGDEINLETAKYNQQVTKLDSTITSFNNIIEEKPEGGVFNSANNNIEIYVYGSKNEYIHLAAHELGHALKLDHTSNPNAIMNPRTSDKITLTNDDLILLRQQCATQNRLKLFSQNIKNKLQLRFQ